MRGFVFNLCVILTYASAYAQQWVWDEIADERGMEESEDISLGSLLIGIVFIGCVWVIIYLIKDALETIKFKKKIAAERIEKAKVEEINKKKKYLERYQQLIPTPIDLGVSLPILWSDINLGSSLAFPPGNWFHWGGTKSTLMFASNERFLTDSMSIEELKELFSNGSYNFSGLKDYDAASAIFGLPWRTPTEEEFLCLIKECNWKLMEKDNKTYWKVVGPNGNFILLPELRDKIEFAPSLTEFWTSSPSISDESVLWDNNKIRYSKKLRIWGIARSLNKSDDKPNIIIEDRLRFENSLIRPVMDKIESKS